MKKQLLTLSTLFITYIASAQVGIGTTSPSEALDVETSDATKTAIDINNTSTGDPKINFQLNGTTNFSIGIDNSDSDKLKIGTSALETNTAITIDGSQNVGVGTSSPISGLDIQTSMGLKVTTITAATTLNNTHNVVLCNTGPYTVTLPAASACSGRVYKLKNIDPTSAPITIDGNGADLIEGNPTYSLYPYKNTITIISDGTQWHAIESYSDSAVGAISALNCGSATHNGVLAATQVASGVSSEIPYTGGNGGAYAGQTVSSTGVTGLTATLVAGNFTTGSGSLTYAITGTPTTAGTASFAISIAGRSCTLTRTVVNVGTITGLTCGSATNNGTLNAGSSASGVTSVVPYTGGNGGFHNGQTVASTGVTGLTATVAAGVFANGDGNLTYTITGNPDFAGTATFDLNIGGRTCTLARTVSCMTVATTVVDVVSPTGRTWMDRNLGATRQATSFNDQAAYGDLYQWGRLKDGHQCRYSSTTSTQSSSDVPGHGNFIIGFNDWRNPSNTNLWQGVSGTNNPCPSGYRLPTETELNNERLSWSSSDIAGAFASPLKFTTGARRYSNGGINDFTMGLYWSSTISGSNSRYLVITSSSFMFTEYRAMGSSVRCIKD